MIIFQWTQDLANIEPETQVTYRDKDNIIVEDHSVWLGREISRSDPRSRFNNVLEFIKSTFTDLNP